jgi:hypothetical protein
VPILLSATHGAGVEVLDQDGASGGAVALPLLHAQADYAAARAYLERALAVYRELLHEDHHAIARIRGLLATMSR